MPELKDIVSKFEISPELTHQESYRTTILKWMQDTPAQTKNTTFARMARTMALGRVTDQKEQGILFTLYNMSHDGLITYSGHNASRRKTFFINYLHQACPPEVRERAPKEDIERAKKVVGIVEAKLAGIQQDAEEKITNLASTQEVVPETLETSETSETPEVSPVPQLDIPIELDKMPNGGFTLQLNINFTINSKS